ncbi:hypothetical protein ACFWGN_14980 [Oerskovia sp. NPDC060338]|uniref:hypothetical protein n=1 Tax=Oerskovia sp. NPDC060338 TaxID=3347100 RepID=UPI0036654243
MSRMEATPWGLSKHSRSLKGGELRVEHRAFPVDVTPQEASAFIARAIWDDSPASLVARLTPVLGAGLLGAAIADQARARRRAPWAILGVGAGALLGHALYAVLAPDLPAATRRRIDAESIGFSASLTSLTQACQDDDETCQETGRRDFARAVMNLLTAAQRITELGDLPDTARLLAHMWVRRYIETERSQAEPQGELAQRVADELGRLTEANARP